MSRPRLPSHLHPGACNPSARSARAARRSRAKPIELLPTAALALGFAAFLCACQGPAATVVRAPLGGQSRLAAILPDALDRSAAELAVATLSGDAERVAAAREQLEQSERALRGDGEPSGLVPFGLEAADAVLAPGRGAQAAVRQRLERDDVEPALRERLERELEADPLHLAEQRLFEARYAAFARLFNAVSTPVGRSLLNPIQLPYALGYSVARAAVDTADGDSLDLRRRQALFYWEEFARRHPEAPELAELAPRIERYRERWNRTRAERALEQARDALDDGRTPAALIYAERSLRQLDGDPARQARDRARAKLAAEQGERDRSLGFAPALASVLGPGEAAAIRAALSGEPLPDPGDPLLEAPAHFLAGASRQVPAPDRTLEELAEQEDSPMARHAAAELADPVRHPVRAWRSARSAERWRTARWVVLGPLVAKPDRGGLGVARYFLDLPLRVQALVWLPVRALELTWRKPGAGQAQAAVHARRSLRLEPEGRDAAELRQWLVRHERRRGNWLGVLRLAESDPDADPEELAELRERAAEQGLEVGRGERRRDLRAALLTDVARRFGDTEAGREAARAARQLALETPPHEIRFSRGFLLENPEIAGARGLDLSPALLDEDLRNGELHPDGVALVGGRRAEVSLVAASGDDEDPAEKLSVTLPADRLSRLVARVEETRFRRALLDPDEALVADPQRDAVFERARLGLADAVDTRPGAEARHTYLGLSERYGMVRGRESLLPVELVVQGSLYDLSLGAFPRLIPPEPTPDAGLFRD